ncbi:MAG TPA: hypothetical protein VJA46_03980 [Acidimicrobiia bacterium]|nr:hypothetical protein [Acidimicrobiia bacterium]
MIATHRQSERIGTQPSSIKFGYVVAILVNAAMLVIANNFLDWGWLPFLTDDFGRILWLLDISFLAAILVNSIYLGYDPAWFKSMCQIGLSGISMAVAIRTYQVFPFDFARYQFDWGPVTRFVLVLVMVGVGFAIITEVVKLARGIGLNPQGEPQSHTFEEVGATGAGNDRQQS